MSVLEFRQCKYDIAVTQWVASEWEWINASARLDWLVDVLEFAATTGKLEMLKLAHKLRLDMLENTSHETCGPVLRSEMSNEAAASGHLPVVLWLNSHQGQELTANTMNRVAAK